MPVRRDSKETRRIGGSYPLAASQPQTVGDRLLSLLLWILRKARASHKDARVVNYAGNKIRDTIHNQVIV